MIVRGSATVNADGSVTLQAPTTGFASVHGLRLANYTSNVLILSDVDPDERGSQEYLLPLQQNVYRVTNSKQLGKLSDVTTGSVLNTAGVLVEWSTDPGKDFAGKQYPTTVSTGGVGAPSTTITQFALTDSGVIYTIPANPFRTRLQLLNYCGADIKWSSTFGGMNAAPTIKNGSVQRTITGTGAIYLQPTVDNSYIEVIEESVIPVSL